jgi:importin-5
MILDLEGLADTGVLKTRAFAAVIFRRIATKTRKTPTAENADMFISLNKESAVVIRTKLLEILVTETDRTVRNKISDAVAEVGRQYSENSLSI